MASTFSWSRQFSRQSSLVAGRVIAGVGAIPDGGTLERVIFSFQVYQHVFSQGLTAVPSEPVLPVGIINRPLSLSVPLFDPSDNPNADWLWAGLIPLSVLQLRSTSDKEYAVQFSSPAGQLETTTRRKNTSGELHVVWFVTGELANVDSGFPDWNSCILGSTLYSEPA